MVRHGAPHQARDGAPARAFFGLGLSLTIAALMVVPSASLALSFGGTPCTLEAEAYATLRAHLAANHAHLLAGPDARVTNEWCVDDQAHMWIELGPILVSDNLQRFVVLHCHGNLKASSWSCEQASAHQALLLGTPPDSVRLEGVSPAAARPILEALKSQAVRLHLPDGQTELYLGRIPVTDVVRLSTADDAEFAIETKGTSQHLYCLGWIWYSEEGQPRIHLREARSAPSFP